MVAHWPLRLEQAETNPAAFGKASHCDVCSLLPTHWHAGT